MSIDDAAVRRRHPKSRTDQIEDYIDLLLDIDKADPSQEMHDRIERALAALRDDRDVANTRMVVYDVPIRLGAPFGRFTLPMNLTAAEADRICAVIRSLAFPDAPEETR